MRIIALEEHFNTPSLVKRIPSATIASRGWTAMPSYMQKEDQLADLGSRRIADMDQAGVTMQVLSVGGPGANLLRGSEAIRFASDSNQQLANAVKQHPDRFAGFAHLAVSEPATAADELTRCVLEYGFYGALISGTAQGAFLDNSFFWPILAEAERLQVPLYLHPDLPPQPVYDSYYAGLPEETGILMASAGWRWHYETSVHVLRLVVSGTLERFPSLKLIAGHMGEGLPAMMARCDEMFEKANARRGFRAVSETLQNQMWITTSGFHDRTSFEAARQCFGLERMLFSADYPYNSSNVTRFFETARLSSEESDQIAHLNAVALLGIR